MCCMYIVRVRVNWTQWTVLSYSITVLSAPTGNIILCITSTNHLLYVYCTVYTHMPIINQDQYGTLSDCPVTKPDRQPHPSPPGHSWLINCPASDVTTDVISLHLHCVCWLCMLFESVVFFFPPNPLIIVYILYILMILFTGCQFKNL